MIGGWEGTVTFNISAAGLPSTTTCRETWVITNQAAGNFNGTWQTSSGTSAACSQSGGVQGVVTPQGGVTDIVYDAVVNPGACTRTMRTAMAGAISGTNLSAQTTEQLRCSGVNVSRSIAITMTKR